MKITKYRKCDKEGSLLGYFSMTYVDSYGERFINDMKLFRNRDGHQFIVHPDRSYQTEDGQTKFAAYTGYTERAFSDKFQIDVLKALNEYMTQNHNQGQRYEAGGTQECVKQPSQVQYPHVNNVNRNQNEELPF
jgi:hypothetical protein